MKSDYHVRCRRGAGKSTSRARRLTFEAFEPRLPLAGTTFGDGNPAPVFDSTAYPHSAVVQLDLYYDVDADGEISKGDYVSKCSGALIGNFQVLTAAHCLYNTDPNDFRHGWVDRVYVHAGRDGEYDRPFGEARAVKMVVPEDWIEGDYKSDLGLLTLDRNLGESTGYLGFDVLAKNEKEKTIEFFRKIGGAISTVAEKVGVSDQVPNRPKLSILHYPAERKQDGDPFLGQDQYLSSGRARSISIDGEVIVADLTSLWVTGGSSGSPVLDGGFDGSQDTIVGVLVRADRADPGGKGNVEITRLTGDWLDFLHDFLDDYPAPTDRPALVDFDRWFDESDSNLSTSVAHANDTVTVRIKVFNAGTATATNVPVSVHLYDDELNPVATLGVPRITSIAPFESRTVTLNAKLPNVAGGDYFIGWRVDELNEVNEFSTPWHDLVVSANKAGPGYIKSLGTLSFESDVNFRSLKIRNDKPVFAKSTRQSFEVYQGERIAYDFDATDPEGQPIAWRMTRDTLGTQLAASDATFNPLTGDFSWLVGPQTTPGTYWFTILASDGQQSTKRPISIKVLDAQPIAKGLYSDHETIYDDGRDRVTLAVGLVKSGRPGEPVGRVEFFLDQNRNGILDIDPSTGDLIDARNGQGDSLGKDVMVGFDTYGADGRSWSGAIGGLAAGTSIKMFAQTVRYGEHFTFRSQPAETTIDIVAAPVIPPVAIPLHDQQISLFPSGFNASVVKRDASGRYFVFQPNDSAQGSINLRLLSNQGELVGPAVTLDGARGGHELRNLAVRPNGEVVVVNWDSNQGQYVARRYTADGSPIGSNPLALGRLPLPDGADIDVEVDASGNILIVGSLSHFSPAEIVARRYTWDGTPLQADLVLYQRELTSFEYGGVDMMPDGRFLVWYVVWDASLGPVQWSTRAQFFDAAGAPLGEEIVIQTSCCSLTAPEISLNASGEFIALYEDGNLMARRFDRTGAAVGDPFRLNTSLLQRQGHRVSLSDSGWFVAAWTVRNRDPGDGPLESGVYFQIVDANNVRRGPETMAPTITRADQGSPNVVMDADGDLLVVWDDVPVRFRAGAPYGRAFAVNLPPIAPALESQTAVVGQSFELSATASDPDRPAQELTYALGPATPTGVTIDAVTGLVCWTPSATQVGQQVIRVAVNDNGIPAQTVEFNIPIEVVRPDIVVRSLTGVGRNIITLTYEIVHGEVPAFDLGFYRSADGAFSTDDAKLASITISAPQDRQPGVHVRTLMVGGGTNQIPFPGAGLPVVRGDHRLLVVADPADLVLEEDAHPTNEDNTARFTGAYRLPGGPLFVHGTDAADGLVLKKGSVVVILNGEEWIYEEDEVPEVFAWLGEGNDLLEGNDVAVPIIAWAGSGNDILSGGAATNVLDAGEGDDEVLASSGTDEISASNSAFTAPTLTPRGTVTETSPTINWSEVPRAARYVLQLVTEAGTWLETVSSTETSATLKSRLPSGTYEARVKAVDAEEQVTSWSAPMRFVIDEPAPGAPTLTEPPVSVETAYPRFSWSIVDAAVAYEIRVARAADSSIIFSQQVDQVHEFTALAPLPAENLTATVRALNADGDVSDWSAPRSFNVILATPDQPVLLGPSGNLLDTAPLFSWLAPTSQGHRFELQIDRTTVGSEAPEFVKLTGIPGGQLGVTSHVLGAPLDEGAYVFRVRGVTPWGDAGPWSGSMSFTVDLADVPPTTPELLAVPEAPLGSLLTFGWTLEPTALTYELLVERVVGEAAEVAYQRAGLATGQLEIPHRFATGNYRARVRAENDLGVSHWSDAQAFVLPTGGSGPQWQNDRLIWDVNDDQFVSPIDALTIINALNDELGGPLPERAGLVAPFYDTNGDHHLSAVDALIVINELNSPTRSGVAGEATAPSPTANTNPSPPPATAKAPLSPNSPDQSRDVIFASYARKRLRGSPKDRLRWQVED